MLEWLHCKMFAYWMVFGMKILGYKHVDVYVPNEDSNIVVGITFSTHEYYINMVSELEV